LLTWFQAASRICWLVLQVTAWILQHAAHQTYSRTAAPALQMALLKTCSSWQTHVAQTRGRTAAQITHVLLLSGQSCLQKLSSNRQQLMHPCIMLTL
jgi:hypothetical protein